MVLADETWRCRQGRYWGGKEVQEGDVVRYQTIFLTILKHPIQPNQQSDLYTRLTQLTKSKNIFTYLHYVFSRRPVRATE